MQTGAARTWRALRIRSSNPFFVNAVNVHSGLSRVFGPAHMGNLFMMELTPLHRPETLTTGKNTLNRINEIASINGLLAELSALDTLNRTAPEPACQQS